jgi:hypothetical protein
MVMRNLMKVGLAAMLVAGTMAISACGSSNNNSGTGGNTGVVTGPGGSGSGTGGSGTDGGGTGGSAGMGGAGGAAPNAHQDHLNIINKSTQGGMPVNRAAPVPYDTCKI